jgi:hypothetical protein
MQVECRQPLRAAIAFGLAVALGCGERGIMDPAPSVPEPLSDLAPASALLPLDVFGVGPLGGHPCSAAPYRDFDFWVGNWDVFGGSSQTLAGTNVVKSLLDGCLVEENWTGAFGFRGRSLNAFDHASRTWSQMWVDQGGCPTGVILIEGGLVNGAMLMAGTRAQPEGFLIAPPCGPPPGVVAFTRTNRIRWTPLASGSVLQQLQATNNGDPLPDFPDANLLIGLRYDPVETVTSLPPPPTASFCPFRAATQQFNFMIGTWNVHQGTGQGSQGTATFSKDLNQCLVEEHFAALGGYEGISYNTFDVYTQLWTRTYVDNQGQRLFMTGGLTGTDMQLVGTKGALSGAEVMLRVTWSPVSTDEVRQTWEFSRDGGNTWRSERILRYTRAS